MPQVSLVIELGRYLVGEAGIYVTRIVDRKVSRGQVFLVTTTAALTITCRPRAASDR